MIQRRSCIVRHAHCGPLGARRGAARGALLGALLCLGTARIAVAQDPVHHPTLVDEDWQHTVQVDAGIGVGRRISLAGSVIYAGNPAHQAFRLSTTLRIGRLLSLSAGYGETRSSSVTPVSAIDHVYRGSASLEGRVGAWLLSNRALLEGHRHTGHTQLSFRDRLRVDFAPPQWSHVRIFVSGEGEDVMHSTIPRTSTGWHRALASAGVRRNLVSATSVELYTSRAFVRGRSPSTNIGLLVALHLDARKTR